MKTIRLSSLFAAIIIAFFIITSCSSPEGKLAGTWVTENVSVTVDSAKANLASVDATIASTRSMKFTLNDDHSMSLIVDGYTIKGYWVFESETGKVSYRLDSEFGEEFELGKLEGSKIICSSNMKHGSINSVHVKE